MTSGRAGLGADKRPGIDNSEKKWRYDVDERSSVILLIIYYGHDVRGSIMCRSGTEAMHWSKMIEGLNDATESE